MKKLFVFVFFCICAFAQASAQTIDFVAPSLNDEAQLSTSFNSLSKVLIEEYREQNRERYLNNLFRLQIVNGRYAEAVVSIKALRELMKAKDPISAETAYLQYEMYANAKLKMTGSVISTVSTLNTPTNTVTFDHAFQQVFQERFEQLDDLTAVRASGALMFSLERARNDLQKMLTQHQGKSSIEVKEAIALIRIYQPYLVYRDMLPLTNALLADDDRRRYFIQDDVLIKTPEGITLSALVVRPRQIKVPLPTALFVNIYVDPVNNLAEAKQSAARGYIGVVVDPRGKRLSPDAIVPYETEARDMPAVIDWISKQAWSDGRVGMYGGSYSGFAAWAATKQLHPALKTIVPYAAAIPGLGVPMENNVFLTVNYAWPFYVTNNKTQDNETYNDYQRWQSLPQKWYASGRAYREIDKVDGTPNKFLQHWLQHPSYDLFWQSMVPYGQDYAHINIPVLSVTGYFDDGQISALHYLREHYKYNPKADHYLIIGPYEHFSLQTQPFPVVNEYAIDPVAHINTVEITYQWFDHIFRGAAKPALLKDKINYQVMGANEWRHAPSLEKAADQRLKLYLSDAKSGNYHRMSKDRPAGNHYLEQTVDFADRASSNNDYYPNPIIRKEIDLAGGLAFISEPFDEAVSVTGMFSGQLKAIINKKDMDIGIVLYEVMPNGEYFHLAYFLGRASYAQDMAKRKLLTSGKLSSISFERSRMTSRQLSKGSRILAVLNINKNSVAQINYGTGKDVSDESITDAKIPLKIKWYSDSYLSIPLSRP